MVIETVAGRRFVGTRLYLRTFWIATAVGLAVSIVCRLYALTGPALSMDDYLVLYEGSAADWSKELSGGRSGIFILIWIRNFLGIDYLMSAPLAPFLGMAMLSAVGTFLGAILFWSDHKKTIIFAAIYSAHPYLTEYFYFNSATFQIALSLFLSIGGIFLICERMDQAPIHILAGFTAIILSLFIYTASVAYIGALILLIPLAALLINASWRELFIRWAHIFVPYAFCLVLYFGLNFILLKVSGISSSRIPDMAGLQSIDSALRRIFTSLNVAFGVSTNIISFGSQILLAVCGLLCMFSALLASPSVKSKIPMGILAVLGSLAALLWSPAIIPFFSPIGWSAIRLVSPVAVPVAAVLAAGLSTPNRSYFSITLFALVALLQVSFIATSNRMLYEQRLVNDWDGRTSSRIVARLESDPQFSKVKRLFITGAQQPLSQPLSTRFADMNQFPLSVEWSKLGVFAAATGYRFEKPTATEVGRGKAYCAANTRWPHHDSTVIEGELAIVCL